MAPTSSRPAPSMRLTVDLMRWCARHVPRWNTISVSGYHMREAGSTAAQEIAFTLADAVAYVRAAQAAGLDVDAVAPRLSFFFACHGDLFEEVAKFRAARRMWAHLARDLLGAREARSQMLRFHTQTGGSTLTAQQPLANVVRTAYQALAAVLGGTQSLHTNGFDEALGLPTEASATLALRTQQVLAFETGVPEAVDPLAGSVHVEALTDRIEAEARRWFDEVEARGGAVAAIEAGYLQEAIEEAAYAFQKDVESGARVVVGVNRFADDAAGRRAGPGPRSTGRTGARRGVAGVPRRARRRGGLERRRALGGRRARRGGADGTDPRRLPGARHGRRGVRGAARGVGRALGVAPARASGAGVRARRPRRAGARSPCHGRRRPGRRW